MVCEVEELKPQLLAQKVNDCTSPPGNSIPKLLLEALRLRMNLVLNLSYIVIKIEGRRMTIHILFIDDHTVDYKSMEPVALDSFISEAPRNSPTKYRSRCRVAYVGDELNSVDLELSNLYLVSPHLADPPNFRYKIFHEFSGMRCEV